jgi:hypothetical protein
MPWRRLLIVPERIALVLTIPFAAGLFLFGGFEMWLHEKRTGKSGDPFEGF